MAIGWSTLAVSLLLRSFMYVWASIALVACIARAFFDGAFWFERSATDKQHIQRFQDKYWNLSKAPFEGYRHAFWSASGDGIRLHYVVSDLPSKQPRQPHVVVFIHGFPDSYVVWRRVLQSNKLQSSAVLIAVDLPGFGGSSGCPKYGTNVLDVVSQFIVGMRESYLGPGGRVVVVGHDWGGVISARLASDARELADQFIIVSAVIPQQARMNITNMFTLAKHTVAPWYRDPLASLTPLKLAWRQLAPVRDQISCSWYIFVFQFPKPLVDWFCQMGNYWFLRLLHDVQAGRIGPGSEDSQDKFSQEQMLELIAQNSGPTSRQLKEALLDDAGNAFYYPADVSHRLKDMGMSEKIRLYREGLALGRWRPFDKANEQIRTNKKVKLMSEKASLGGNYPEKGVEQLQSDVPPAALKHFTTFIYGVKDVAFNMEVAYGNLLAWLPERSRGIGVKAGKHWLPTEMIGVALVEETAYSAVTGKDTDFSAVRDQLVVDMARGPMPGGIAKPKDL